MDKFNIDLGKRIRYTRESHGYSREHLAELADMSANFLYEVETGKKGVSAYKMYKLSLALHVTMNYLADGEESGKSINLNTESGKPIHLNTTCLEKIDLLYIENILQRLKRLIG